MSLPRQRVSGREFVVLILVSLFPAALLGTTSMVLGNFREALWIMQVVCMASLPIGLFIGLPSIYILNSIKRVHVGYYVLVGVIVGMCLTCYFVLMPMFNDGGFDIKWRPFSGQFAILMMLSIATTVLYWIFARPDKTRSI